MARRRERRRLEIVLPEPARERLAFVRLLDGRTVAEWARATLLEALSRLLLERPGWAWARAGAPFWRDPGAGRAGGAPLGTLAGGERVAVLAVLPGALEGRTGEGADPGEGLLVDVLPAEGESAGLLRRVLVASEDVLPWRDGRARRSGWLPEGSPGADAADERARLGVEAERARRKARRSEDAGGREV